MYQISRELLWWYIDLRLYEDIQINVGLTLCRMNTEYELSLCRLLSLNQLLSVYKQGKGIRPERRFKGRTNLARLVTRIEPISGTVILSVLIKPSR